MRSAKLSLEKIGDRDYYHEYPLTIKLISPYPMPYQYKREPLSQDEANRLATACRTHEEKLVV